MPFGDPLPSWGPNGIKKLSFPSYADQRKEDKLMEEPQNAYFLFSYFPLTESLIRGEIPPTI